jgi:hypothetical protein
MTESLNYQTPSASMRNPLRVPAILLLCFGGCTLLAIALDLLDRMFGWRIFHFGVTIGPRESGMCFNALSTILLIVMMVGAVHMLRLRSYGMAMTAAILAIVPLTAVCCCIFTLPAGVWALLLLLRPEVKSLFVNRGQWNL